MSSPIEITSNVVALFKLPMPVKELAGVIEHLESSCGAELRMEEKPRGWLQIFKPEPESEVGLKASQSSQAPAEAGTTNGEDAA